MSEKEQIALIKDWWRDNGRFVLTGLALGLAILFGWRAWQGHLQERAETASASYSKLLEAVERQDRDLALELGQELVDDYRETPYAGQAALTLAKLHVVLNELDDAELRLKWVAEESDDASLKQVARLRLARVMLQLKRADEALAVLDESDWGAFTAQWHEVQGDAHLARGDHGAARSEYESALNTDLGPVIDRNLLQIKLDSLARTEPEAPTLEESGSSDDSEQAESGS